MLNYEYKNELIKKFILANNCVVVIIMLNLFKKRNDSQVSTAITVDIIESVVAPYLKENGFKKHGRTYCRFVDTDIAQVVHFQNGCFEKGVTGLLWINLGIRIPECVERKFTGLPELKKYYHEYDCNIRCMLGELTPDKNNGYDLKKSPEKIAEDIIKNLKEYAMPVFNILNTREAISLYRKKYKNFDILNSHLRLLDESMIYGRMGNIEKAADLFNLYYDTAVEKQRDELTDGSYDYYKPNFSHIDYLENLANELGIQIINPWDKNIKKI